MPPLQTISCAIGICALASPVTAQLRVVQWNITNYSGGRVSEFETAFYGVNPANGLSLRPDVVIVQELLSNGGVTAFLNLLNNAPGSPGDWAAAPFVNGPDTDNGFFWRTSKIDYLGTTIVSTGGPSPNHPRHLTRYDARLEGYAAASTTLACYCSHMKAGSGGTDQARRLVEAMELRDDAMTLPSQWNFLIGADMNIQQSSQSAYQHMVQAGAGQLIDPIATPGNWNNNGAYHIVHTQDPAGAGGMDDRHDQILLSTSLIDGEGLDYIGNPFQPYSTSTWNDSNHSYRSWGNDGTSFNVGLRINGNTMVGPVIAQALVDSAGNGGHLPVLLELQVPPVIAADKALGFGQVNLGDPVTVMLNVANDGDVAVWNAEGIEDLSYTLSVSADVSVPPGPHTEPAGGGGNVHIVSVDTSSVGVVDATIVINSNAPDASLILVSVQGEVIDGGGEPCVGDIDDDGVVGITDLLSLLAAWGDCAACAEDLDGDDAVTITDLLTLLANWGACP